MSKKITRIVLTGGPAAGKTTLISRILKEFTPESGWKVVIIPETATELISGFGIGPFPGCMSMLEFQYFVIEDQLHKESLALKAAETVPEEKVLIIYDRAVFDDKAYISDEEFRTVLAHFGKTEEQLLAGYDAVLHLVSCAKGAEFAYDYGNAARYETVEQARAIDDKTIRAWSAHPSLHIIDNSVDFEDKINRAIAAIYRVLGQEVPDVEKKKYLIAMPEAETLVAKYGALPSEMMQTYLITASPLIERRVRQQRSGREYLYFFTEKRIGEDGKRWVTERPISEKEYIRFLMESDLTLRAVRKTKYRFHYAGHAMEIDLYPFSEEKAILFVYGDGEKDAELKSLALESGVKDRVHLLGRRNDVAELLHAADVYLLPSIREGLNVSVMEAMSAGLPVVCNDIRGNDDLIKNGEGGFLCALNDEGAWLNAICALAELPEKRGKMGEYNIVASEQYSMGQIIEKTLSLYREITE